jgi:hypothetical protein
MAYDLSARLASVPKMEAGRVMASMKSYRRQRRVARMCGPKASRV